MAWGILAFLLVALGVLLLVSGYTGYGGVILILGAAAAVKPITTAEYPTPARRPANSRLDCSKLSAAFGITLPDWREGVAECVARLASLDRAIRNPGQQTA